MKETDFNTHYIKKHKPLYTLTAKGEHSNIHFEKPVYISAKETILGSSFPNDYNFTAMTAFYVCGMSVPPVMTANIATEIYNQWLSKIP